MVEYDSRFMLMWDRIICRCIYNNKFEGQQYLLLVIYDASSSVEIVVIKSECLNKFLIVSTSLFLARSCRVLNVIIIINSEKNTVQH